MRDTSPSRNIVMHIFPKVIETSANPDIRSMPTSLLTYKYIDETPITIEVIIIVMKK